MCDFFFFFSVFGPVFNPCCCPLEGSSHSSWSSEGQQGSINLYVNVKRDGQSGGGVYFGEFGVAELPARLVCQCAADS